MKDLCKQSANVRTGRYNRASGMTVTKWRAEKSVWKRQLRKLEDLGVVFIQAAGNNGYNPQNPNDQVYKTGMLMPPVLGRATNNVSTKSRLKSYLSSPGRIFYKI